MNIIKTNLQIISVLNSCDRKKFEALVTDAITNEKIFRSKLYIWNWIRGRDFYKMLSHYTITNIEQHTEESMNRAETIIKMVLDTAKDETIKRNFIWAIMKQVPLLTADTIRYASADKITSLLQSDKELITDSSINPIVLEVYRLRKKIHNLEEEVQMYQLMADNT